MAMNGAEAASQSQERAKIIVYAALAANCGIAVTKFGAAALSGSSAMLAEGIHGLPRREV